MASDNIDRELAALFKEYDTLRTEILARVRTRFELLGVLVAGITLVLARGTLWLLVPLCLGLGGLWLYLGTAVLDCANRLVEIEARVNVVVRSDKAPSSSDPLPMRWETTRQGVWKRKWFPHW